MTDIQWPKGYPTFYSNVRIHAKTILSETVLALDPSSGGSSLPGYAIFHAGICIAQGTIPFPKPKRNIYLRLQFLYDEVAKLLPVPPAILVIEEVHKNMSGADLQYAIGTSIAAARAPVTIALPINVWKSVAKVDPHYIKGDAEDAAIIGKSLVLLAQKGVGT